MQKILLVAIRWPNCFANGAPAFVRWTFKPLNDWYQRFLLNRKSVAGYATQGRLRAFGQKINKKIVHNLAADWAA
jgi:hypothetical protein